MNRPNTIFSYNLGYAFERVVEEFPDRPALAFSGDERFSYAVLNATANKIARYLAGHGVAQGDVVCISGIKTLESYASILACLKLGAIYCVLDFDSPFERLRKIINRCQPRVILVDQLLGATISADELDCETELLVFDGDAFQETIAGNDDTNLDETGEITAVNPAYIMFTSGSTGFPKGAVLTHQNVLNLIQWSKATYQTSPEDVFTNVNPLYFDNSVFDLYSSLFIGACLVPFSKDEMTNPKGIVEKIDALKCTSWFSVPSLLIYLTMMRVLNKDNMSHLKRFIFGGEGYPKPKLKTLYDLYADRVELHNVYGPTECTCICSSRRVTADDVSDDSGLPPLGEIAPNFSYLILDDEERSVAFGEIGELCLLGPNVALGYFNDPDRTSAAFVQNPANKKFLERMYRTGDLVKCDGEDQLLHFCGRKDNQIKHMGYRIELEEIEAAINSLSYVAEVVVFHGEKRGFSEIAAVVSLSDPARSDDLEEDLEGLIPSYMVPGRFITREDELPKNPAGKIDRVLCKTL